MYTHDTTTIQTSLKIKGMHAGLLYAYNGYKYNSNKLIEQKNTSGFVLCIHMIHIQFKQAYLSREYMGICSMHTIETNAIQTSVLIKGIHGDSLHAYT